jgi:hypothetical protein
VHERIGVDAFDGTGKWKGVINVAATSFSRGETKNRSQSFTSGKKTVPHRLVERGRFRTRFGQIAIQCAVDLFLAGPEIFFEIHGTMAGLSARYWIMQSRAECPVSSIPKC